VILAACALAGASALTQTLAPPGPEERREPHLYAVALEAGALHREADVGSEELFQFRAGQVFDYLGEAEDTFGREWHSLGNNDGWLRVENWYAIPATPEETGNLSGPISMLDILPPPLPIATTLETTESAIALVAATKKPIAVTEDWWDEPIDVDAAALGEFGRVVGVPARGVPADVVSELVDLIGGQEMLGPWPERPGYGRLYVAPRTGLVFRYDGAAWRPTSPPVTMDSIIGLTGNPELRLDPVAPAEATGPIVSCWRLVGGLNPSGAVAGLVGPAPAAPKRLQGATRPDTERFLGYYDLTEKAWPSAVTTMQAPRRVVPAAGARGVALVDKSRRQAVYLEQVIPAELTRRLRGRDLRVRALARASVAAGSSTATAAVEVQAGSLRESLSAQVGTLPTPIVLPFTVPEDAETITIRLLPNDVTIVVTETGTAIFDSVTLVPAEWPDVLEAAPLLLRHVRTVTYRPLPRYTRSALVVTERPRGELGQILRRASDLERPALEKVLAGEVEVDMTEREVQLAWGDPDSVETGELTLWTWDDRAASFDAKGRLLAWSRQPEAEPVRASLCGVPAAVGAPDTGASVGIDFDE
jgi:hypothetical protein